MVTKKSVMIALLFRQTDNAPLIVFRIFFGFLVFLESFGAILTGWVKRVFIEPDFTFTFIGFEWLQPLPGMGMYVYFSVMGLLGLCIMVGYKYKWSTLAFAILWTGTYLMQKTHYNNHYYLLVLLSFIMVFLPAHRYFSVDANKNPNLSRTGMPHWVRLLLMVQMAIVYTYGAVAKLYPDWLDTSVMELLLSTKKNYPLIGGLLQQKPMHYFIAYGGILFDGLIVPLLLYKPTRKIALIASLFFHIFNSLVFQIGIFPYLSLSFSLFFFEPETIRKLFFKRKAPLMETFADLPKNHSAIAFVLGAYLLVQLALPLRHWLIADDVLWTEEGHRMSWRMMLRSRSGHALYTAIDKGTGAETKINLSEYLTPKQQLMASTKPDFIWQMAQKIKQVYRAQGTEVSVYVESWVQINSRPYGAFTNPKVDLANTPWAHHKHAEWILPYRAAHKN